MTLRSLLPLVAPLLLPGCRAPSGAPEPGPSASLPAAPEASGEEAIAAVLDDWHRAASVPDGERYFGHMTADSVYLGTDASERWSLAQFRAFCTPYFARGIGWTYEPRERHIYREGELAWFDEKLWNDKYGLCRGTGAMRWTEGAWRIAHYSLTLLVPNDRAADVVRAIGVVPQVRGGG